MKSHPLRLQWLLTVPLVMFGSLGHATGDQVEGRKPAMLHVDFNESTHVDQAAIKKRDMSKPFAFPLEEQTPRPTPLTLYSDIGTEFKVWFDKNTPKGSPPDERALAVSITSPTDVNVKDKIFFTPVDGRVIDTIPVLQPNNGRFISFSFKLDPGYEVPSFWALHLQALQCCGGNPAFLISSVPGPDKKGAVKLKFEVRDDVLEREKGRPTHVLYELPVDRGRWYKLVLYLQPGIDSAASPGTVAAWLDNRPLFRVNCRWGYQPGAGIEGHEFRDHIGVDLGVYRRRQATTQTIYFADVNYGSSCRDVGCNF